MNKRKIFILLPTILCFGVLSGCKGGGGDTPTPTPTPEKTLTSITVTPTMKTYSVGMQFTKESIGSFQANYSDGSTVSIKEGYTCDPELPYTFKESDVANGKDFNFTYQEKTASFHVKVINPTYPIDFDFTPTSDNKIDVDLNSTRQVQIKFKDSSYESNYESITWTYDNKYIEKIEDKGKTFKFKAIKNTTQDVPTELKVVVVNKTGTITKNQTCLITISEFEEKPMFYYQSWYSYLRDNTISSGTDFKFTAIMNGTNKLRYFGMSKYSGETPYFSIGLNDESQDVNVTKISLNNGQESRDLSFTGDKPEVAVNDTYKVAYFSSELFKIGYKKPLNVRLILV